MKLLNLKTKRVVEVTDEMFNSFKILGKIGKDFEIVKEVVKEDIVESEVKDEIKTPEFETPKVSAVKKDTKKIKK